LEFKEEGILIMYLTDIERNKLVEYLINTLKPEFIYLYGSFAIGEGRADSDIDLAIYTDKEVSPYELFIISNKLSFMVGRDVEIVNLKAIDTVFASQIVGNREELYCKNDLLRANFNIRIFKEYAKLNEERKIVLDAIEKDGRVYG
jgi:uncharacterized protein